MKGSCLTLRNFNDLHINCLAGLYSGSSGFFNKLLEIIQEEFLFGDINSPVKLREGNNPSTDDLVFTKHSEDVSA